VLPAAELPAVAHRVYIAASLPVAGRRALDDLPSGVRILNRAAIRLQRRGVTTPPRTMEKMIRSRFCNASDESVIQEVLRHPVLRKPPCFAVERIPTTASAHGPSTDIRLPRELADELNEIARIVIGGTGRADRALVQNLLK